MIAPDVPPCACRTCQQDGDHPDRERHRQVILVPGRLDEQQRREPAALGSNRIGRGGDTLLAQITMKRLMTL